MHWTRSTDAKVNNVLKLGLQSEHKTSTHICAKPISTGSLAVRFDKLGDVVTASYNIVNLRKETENQNDISHVWVGDWNKTREPRISLGNIKIKWNPHDMQASLPRSICVEECPPGTKKSVTTPHC